jgi:hypothetical protein
MLETEDSKPAVVVANGIAGELVVGSGRATADDVDDCTTGVLHAEVTLDGKVSGAGTAIKLVVGSEARIEEESVGGGAGVLDDEDGLLVSVTSEVGLVVTLSTVVFATIESKLVVDSEVVLRVESDDSGSGMLGLEELPALADVWAGTVDQ